MIRAWCHPLSVARLHAEPAAHSLEWRAQTNIAWNACGRRTHRRRSIPKRQAGIKLLSRDHRHQCWCQAILKPERALGWFQVL